MDVKTMSDDQLHTVIAGTRSKVRELKDSLRVAVREQERREINVNMHVKLNQLAPPERAALIQAVGKSS